VSSKATPPDMEGVPHRENPWFRKLGFPPSSYGGGVALISLSI